MSAIKRNNVSVHGKGTTAMVFSHGFGCDQNMWRLVAPSFTDAYQVVVFDQMGTGGSQTDMYEPAEYDSLQRYADDLIEICDELNIQDAIFVGHSVSSMIGVLASIRRPDCFSKLVLVGPSPRYINEGEYIGGFEQATIDSMLEMLQSNYSAWARTMAPVIMGNLDRPELGAELGDSFCRFEPEIAMQFARLTFLSDNRADLGKVNVPTLILQCSEDPIAPEAVGRYVHARIKGSRFMQLQATGHCPNMSAPEETIAAIRTFL